MTQYLVAIQHPRGYDNSVEDAAMHRNISRLNEEMLAAGVRCLSVGWSRRMRPRPCG